MSMGAHLLFHRVYGCGLQRDADFGGLGSFLQVCWPHADGKLEDAEKILRCGIAHECAAAKSLAAIFASTSPPRFRSCAQLLGFEKSEQF